MTWTNNFRLIGTAEVIYSFVCHCAPDSRIHEKMLAGALRNMRDDAYLEDGVPEVAPWP